MSRGARDAILGTLAIAVSIAACGGGGSGNAQLKPVDYIRVYASLPRAGPNNSVGAQVASGIQLALQMSDHRAGDYLVRYTRLDANPSRRGRTRAQATATTARAASNARHAAADPNTVLYIGELGSPENQASIPILNIAGIPQISPTSTESGLTVASPGSGGGAPPYYPRGSRTFMRLLPNDVVQAKASLLALSGARCSRVALVYDHSGASLAQLVKAQASNHGVSIVGPTLLTPGAASLLRFEAIVRDARPDCVEIAGSATPTTIQMTKTIHAIAPTVQFLGSDGMCVPAWTNVADGGVQPVLDRLLMCTKPTLPIEQYPGGKAFETQYRDAFGGAVPDVNALLGFTAMQLSLDTIASLGRSGDRRSAVLNGLLHGIHSTPLGIFTFDRNGDTTLNVYGLYKVGDDGDPTFSTILRPNGGP